jgi:phospholipid/cholesterol/gamma-HCH transport system substrate-binding protein
MTKEIKVAILAVVSIAIAYMGFSFLKGSDLFSSSNDYFVTYDNIDGLVASNPVMLNGLSVGRVKEIKIEQSQGNQLLVTLSINKGISLTDSTVAILADGGLLGGKVINLKIGKGKVLASGGKLISTKEVGLSALLKERALPVLSNADSLVMALAKVTSKFNDTGTILNQLLRNADVSLSQTTKGINTTLAENQENLKTLTANLKTLSGDLVQTQRQLPQLLAKANTLADSLSALRLGETLNKAQQMVGSLQKMVASIEAGKGNLGKLTKDEALYNNINRTMVSLDKLLYDFRQVPKRYVHFSLFGKKPKEPATYPDSVINQPVTGDTTKK